VGLLTEGGTYFNFLLPNTHHPIKKKIFLGGGAASQRGYGFSAPKEEMHHPWVQETFPENFCLICYYLLAYTQTFV